ncbi:MAG: aldehyde dehydrogenase family protein [Gammaproteobacteria bacterium]|nr:aldehyde dehydrogenase family protein [Gammaproteobacteria bacterium]
MDDVAFSGEQQVSAFLARCGKLLIDGKQVAAVSGATFDVINPATEQVIARVAHGEKADVDLAVIAARKAFDGGPWVRMAPAERAKLIYKLGEAIDRHADELALIETLDNGKPLKAARNIDIPSSAEKLRYYAGWATKLHGTTADVSLPGDWHAYTLREPVGVAALIVPWNFPLMMAVSKIAPALAAGCTVILKPAEQTPLTALRLGELIQDIGFPPGVINIVTGNLKRVTLELGGKSPVIVFPDANLEQTIEGVSRFIFTNAGQVCAAGSRLYAHKKVFDRIVEGVAARAQKLKVGPGIDATTEMGPLVSQEQLDRVTGYLQSGREAGASVVTGGKRFGQSGYFVEPTILADTTVDMAVRREEIFGPVLCAATFDDDSLDAIAAEANNTTYGLSAYVWTQNLGVAHKMAKRLKSGFIRINGGGLDNALPFGGYKQSGWGRENAREGVETFTEVKSVIIGL